MFFHLLIYLTSKIILTNHNLNLPLVVCTDENKRYLVNLLNMSKIRSAMIQIDDKNITLRKDGKFAENRSDFKFYSKDTWSYNSKFTYCPICKKFLDCIANLLGINGMICNIPFGDIYEEKIKIQPNYFTYKIL